MPLNKGSLDIARLENIHKLISEGRDPKQAVAIAYSEQRLDLLSRLRLHNCPAMTQSHFLRVRFIPTSQMRQLRSLPGFVRNAVTPSATYQKNQMANDHIRNAI